MLIIISNKKYKYLYNQIYHLQYTVVAVIYKTYTALLIMEYRLKSIDTDPCWCSEAPPDVPPALQRCLRRRSLAHSWTHGQRSRPPAHARYLTTPPSRGRQPRAVGRPARPAPRRRAGRGQTATRRSVAQLGALARP